MGRDPAGMVDGPNLYAYVGNRPTYAFDAYGLSLWSDFGNGLDYTASAIGQSMGQGLYDLSHLRWSQNEYLRIGKLMYSLDKPENVAGALAVSGVAAVSAGAAGSMGTYLAAAER